MSQGHAKGVSKRAGKSTTRPKGDSLIWARRWIAFFAVMNVLFPVGVFYFVGAHEYFAEREYANAIDWGAFGRGGIFLAAVFGSLIVYFGLLAYRPWSRWAFLITNLTYLGFLIGAHALAGQPGIALVYTNPALVLVPGMIYMFASRKARMLFRGGT